VPVNANNDNGSTVIDGWPTRRDFEYPYNPGDIDFVRATIGNIPAGSEGGLYYSATSLSGLGEVVRFWDAAAQNVSNGGPYPDFPTDVFFIEGLEPSLVEYDVQIDVCYHYTIPPDTTVQYGWGIANISVTPIIKNFWVEAVQPTVPTIHFFLDNPLLGLAAVTPDQDEAVEFYAKVKKTSVRGELVFILNVESVGNALHIGSTAGVQYTPGSGVVSKNLLPKPGKAFPMIDSVPNREGFPAYNHESFMYLQKTADIHQIRALDAPLTNTPYDGENSNKISLMDMNYAYLIYLVWKFPGTVFYTLAEIPWHVVFWGDDKKPGGQQGNGLNQILKPFGVVYPGPNNYSRTHAKPGSLKEPVANNDIAYQ
jgi:hypothetical protein